MRFCCPICDKGKKYNLEICINEKSLQYKKYNCWGCSLKGNIRSLLRAYSDSQDWRMDAEFKIDNDVAAAYYNRNKKSDDEIQLPDGTMSFAFHKEVKEYLTYTRGIPEKLLKERNVLYCFSKDDPLYNHIIFPFYEEGKLIGYTVQDFGTKRYKNMRNLNFVAYAEFINWEFPIIITEGIYDCFSTINAIPLFGINLSKELLKRVKDKKIILALDNNNEISIEEKLEIIKKLREWGASMIVVFELGEYKDLNEYYIADRETFIQQMLVLFNLLNFA